MRLNEMFIAGLGSYVPDSFSVKKAVELGLCDASMHEEVGWESVHVAGDTPAPEMAVRAAGVAMGRAGLKPADYALLLHASVSHQGPDSWTPHHYIQARTLGRHGLAIHLREGCQGMLSALDVAARYLGGSPGQPAALVTGSDNWGRPLVDRWRCQPKTVLSDAGAAMVLSRQGGFARVLSVATTCIPELEEMSRTDAPVFPPPVTLGAEMDLAPRELEVVAGRPFEDLFGEVKQGHAEVVAQALAEAGLTADDITKVCMSFVVNSRYVTNVVESLGFPSSCTSWLLEHSREFGHAGSTDPVLGLTHLVETGQVGPGDRLLVMGSTWMIARTCAVVEIVEPVDW